MYRIASEILSWFTNPFILGIFLLIVAFLLRYFKNKKLSFTFLFSGILILYIFSIRPTADFLLRHLEDKYVVDEKSVPGADAIVVLSGYENRYIKGVSLFYKKAAPVIIISGFGGFYDQDPEGTVLKAKFAKKSGIPIEKIIIENKSRNTRENALYTKQILNKINAKKVILVTSAYHMPRSYGVFKKISIDIMPVASDFIVNDKPFDLFSLLPNIQSLRYSKMAIREYVGIMVYRLNGWI